MTARAAEPRTRPPNRPTPSAPPPPAERDAAAERRETTLSLAFEPADFKALVAHPALGGPGKLRWSVQNGAAYDTEAGELRRSGVKLHMRRVGARNVLSLATDDGAYEVTAPDAAPQWELLPPKARDLVERAADKQPLQPCFHWKIRRATRLLSFEGAMIEAAFEDGEIVAEAKRAPVREIALTLKAGEPAALYRLGLTLANLGPVRLAAIGRFERGLALARETAPAAMRDEAAELTAETTLDTAIGALLRENLAHFLSNWPALASTGADEAVHQMRVALRRLRSLLSVLRRSFPAGEVDILRAEAKRTADAFGPARDWRVFSDMAADGLGRRRPDATGLAALIALADARAEAGRAAGATALEGRTTTRFVLALQVYICTRGWRNAATETELRALGEPGLAFAAHALERAFHRLKRRARGFETLAPDARHEMRIALKQLRYVVDFFGPMFESTQGVRRFAGAAAELQDLLGAANDAAVASRLVASLDVGEDLALTFASGAVVGWCERGGALNEKTLRRGWKALRKAERFWRDALVDEAPAERKETVSG